MRLFSSFVAAVSIGAAMCAVPATAQSSFPEIPEQALVSSGSTESIFHNLVTAIANSPGSTPHRLEDALKKAQRLGVTDSEALKGLTSSDGEYPLATDPKIDKLELLRRVDEPGLRIQRWYVASPAMQRVVEVQVMLQKDPSTPAPMLYLLDGISAPSYPGWLREGKLIETMADENVTIAIPTQASASLYADWVNDDPALGRNKWETLITKELPQILESGQDGVNFNGKRAIGGLSMGGGSAVRIAAKNPQVFDATMGMSGCYSTVDPIGRAISKIMVQGRGGNPTNMWGPETSPEWAKNDVTLNPEGLRNMAVYLFTADGHITEGDKQLHKGRPFFELPAAAVLEQGTFRCTQKLEQAMKDAGMTHQTVVYQNGGVHNWLLFAQQLGPAWASVKSALY
ncbi:MAG: alpha/beta hydrolase family protein [Corynebacterium sp.]|uniref:alpha/beta hydrolase n=1 Tax=Corynebacterium sp. TaxID=1720 RepID=UPI0026DC28FE|nr:alpha/beta hydrolase family protein [Corynebacterium sp.]MDO5098093.1 alpha/beta hydrolase family protein [Corynebacterium sp.]